MGASASKQEFRKHVFHLSEKKNLPQDKLDIWSPFWLLPQTVHDVFSLITPRDIARIKKLCPENFATLYFKVFEKLQELLKSKSSTKDKVLKLQLLNCIRVLTRLTPFVYETPESNLENMIFWHKRSNKAALESGENYSTSGIGYLITETALNLMFLPGLTVVEEAPVAGIGSANLENLEITELDLSPNDSKQFIDNSEKYPIWSEGIGVRSPTATTMSTNNEIFNNRLEVLRFILALVSKDMYSKAQTVLESPNKILVYIITHSNSQLLLSVLCSLLNSALRITKTGMFQIGYKPEFLSADTHSIVPIYCAQLFSVLMSSLDYQDGNKNRFYSFVSKIHQNTDYDLIIRHSMNILTMAYDNSQSIIATVTQTQNDKIELASSIILILFQLSESNPSFSNYLSDHNDLPNLFTLLSCLLLLYRGESTRSGLCKFIGLLLHKLSENRNFAITMMRPFGNYYTTVPAHIRPQRNLDVNSSFSQGGSVPPENGVLAVSNTDPKNQATKENSSTPGLSKNLDSSELIVSPSENSNVEPSSQLADEIFLVSSYTDFLIQYTYTMVSESSNNLKPVYSDLFITLRNISPYITNISLYSIKCLFLMFEVFSSPAFMIVDKMHIQWLNCVLESFDYVLHYHMVDNPYFVYQLLNYTDILKRLSTFDYEEAAMMLSSLKKTKELKDAKRNIPTDSPAATPVITSLEPPQTQNSPSFNTNTNIAVTNMPNNSPIANGKFRVDSTTSTTTTSIKGDSASSASINSTTFANRTEPISKSIHSRTDSVYSNIVPKEFVLRYLSNDRINSILSIMNSLEPHVDKIKSEYNNDQDLFASQKIIELLSSETALTLIPHAHLDTALRKPAKRIHKLAIFGNNGKSLFLINFKSEIWGRIFVTCSKPIGLFNGSNVRLVLVKHS